MAFHESVTFLELLISISVGSGILGGIIFGAYRGLKKSQKEAIENSAKKYESLKEIIMAQLELYDKTIQNLCDQLAENKDEHKQDLEKLNKELYEVRKEVQNIKQDLVSHIARSEDAMNDLKTLENRTAEIHGKVQWIEGKMSEIRP